MNRITISGIRSLVTFCNIHLALNTIYEIEGKALRHVYKKFENAYNLASNKRS